MVQYGHSHCLPGGLASMGIIHVWRARQLAVIIFLLIAAILGPFAKIWWQLCRIWVFSLNLWIWALKLSNGQLGIHFLFYLHHGVCVMVFIHGVVITNSECKYKECSIYEIMWYLVLKCRFTISFMLLQSNSSSGILMHCS